MGKEIIINAEKDQTRIALVEEGQLVELYFETTENERTIGDIYLGRVRRIMPSIKAAFVDIGQKQDAFLHFSDLAENLSELLAFVDQDNPRINTTPRTENTGKRGTRRRPRGRRRDREASGSQGEAAGEEKPHVADARTRGKRRSAQRRAKQKETASDQDGRKDGHGGRGIRKGSPDDLKRDQRILVKIVKEPIANKGSRVSTNISLAGRFLVLVPLADYVAVSKKITSPKERRRLRALAKSLLPEGFGVIVRTVAEGKDAKSLDTDLRLLLEKWHRIEKKLAGKPAGPMKVHEDVNMASSIIRDLFSSDYERILVDHPRLYRNIKNYVHAVAPQMAPAVQLYKGKKDIFEATNIKSDIEKAFESRVELPSGGYLFIERTEAMHVIDVNSGRAGRGMNQEENSLKVNLEAARVIARQVRLRDLGGIIVIDFIDMREEANRQKVYDELRKAFRTDRAVTKILPMSDFGLIQITRQRLRPSITTTFSSPNLSANGKGESASEKASDRKTSRGIPQGQEQKPNTDTKTSPEPRKKKKDDAPRFKADVGPSEMLASLDKWIAAFRRRTNRRAVTLRVHPFTAAYLNRPVPSQPTRWFMRHLVRVRLETDPRLHPMTFRFIDPQSGDDITDSVRAETKEQPQT